MTGGYKQNLNGNEEFFSAPEEMLELTAFHLELFNFLQVSHHLNDGAVPGGSASSTSISFTFAGGSQVSREHRERGTRAERF